MRGIASRRPALESRTFPSMRPVASESLDDANARQRLPSYPTDRDDPYGSLSSLLGIIPNRRCQSGCLRTAVTRKRRDFPAAATLPPVGFDLFDGSMYTASARCWPAMQVWRASVWHCARDGEEDAAAFGTAGYALPATETSKLAPHHGDRILEEDRITVSTTRLRYIRAAFATNITKETIVRITFGNGSLRRREMSVPLSHPPGHAQGTFEAGDHRRSSTGAFFRDTSPHCLLRAAYPAGVRAWLDLAQQSLCFFRRRSPTDSLRPTPLSVGSAPERTRAFSGASPITTSRTARPSRQG